MIFPAVFWDMRIVISPYYNPADFITQAWHPGFWRLLAFSGSDRRTEKVKKVYLEDKDWGIAEGRGAGWAEARSLGGVCMAMMQTGMLMRGHTE
jgi:hypothetical protein